MNIDGNTYLFYDKYAGTHSYLNKETNEYTIDSIFKSDELNIKENKEAIEEFNKLDKTNKIDIDLDLNFYHVYLFSTKDNKKIFTIVSINNNQMKDHVNKIPNKDFIKKLCIYHINYTDNIKVNDKKVDIEKELIHKCKDSNTDLTDSIIHNPDFCKLQLFNYQKRTVKWMYDKEIINNGVNYSFNKEVFIGDIVYDTIKKDFYDISERKKLIFNGGLLADEVGLGKTFQIISLSLLHQPNNLSYFQDDNRLHSKATLILCPNQLTTQWIRELDKTVKEDYGLSIVPILTKVHHDKTTYLDLLNADFVIVSYTFLTNDSYYDGWISEMSNRKGKTALKTLSEEEIKSKLNSKFEEIKKNKKLLFSKKPILNLVNFYRIGCDEIHEIFTLNKYSNISILLKFFDAKYKWGISGTPFDKGSCLNELINYTTNYKITDINKILEVSYIQEYLLNSFFRRNTKKSVEDEFKLQPYDEKTILLKLAPIERGVYNAYRVNPNIDKDSVLLRQLCCDPRIVQEIKENLSTCKTPEDIEKSMVIHYKSVADRAHSKVKYLEYRINQIHRNIKIIEYKRQRKYLRMKGYRVNIEYPDKIVNDEFDKKKFIDDDEIENNNLLLDNEVDDNKVDDNKVDEDMNKPLYIINEANQTSIIKLICKELNANPSQTLANIKTTLYDTNDRLRKAKIDYEGKRSSNEFFTNMMTKIKIIENKKKAKLNDNNNDNNDNNDDDDDDEICAICLGEITGDDIGVIKCGHLYCYQCIKDYINKNKKCPTCMKDMKLEDIYMISFDTEKDEVKEVNNTIDKYTLVRNIGTKLANLILYIKNLNEKFILFSQWDDLLVKVGDILDSYGIKNVFCKGNIWMRDKAIREFITKSDVRGIMLSSASAASGTNLTAATTVIMLEPVSGTYEYRRNTEFQAIGRAYRMGQTKKVTVVRFIVKDTIEEEIYNANKTEDAKYNNNNVIIMNDDSINLSKEQIEILAKEGDKNNKIKEEKKPNKKTKTIKKVKEEINVIDIDEDTITEESDDE
jgi:SNF2 family DNA or RNA helicase